MAERRWSGRERGGRGNLFFVFLVRYGGLALTPFFLFWVALYFLVAAPAARRASFELAGRVGKGGGFFRRVAFAYRHFFVFGTMLIDRFAILSDRADSYRYSEKGKEAIVAAAAEGRGAVLVTAHHGNWVIMGHILHGIGKQVAFVMHDAVQPEMRATMEKLSEGRAFRVLKTEGSPESAAEILAALQAGEFVGVMGDRILAGQGAPVDFLGGRAMFPVGAYALAAAAGVSVIHVFSVRTGSRRYAFHGRDAGVPRYTNRRKKQADLARWAQEFATTLEEFVRAYPEQWGNFYPFWEDTRP